MARMVFGNDFGDVANRELGMDAARDSRYFNSLAANRAAQAQRLAQAQAEAGNQLSWEQLLAQAAQQAQRRQDIQGQQGFENQLSLASLRRQTENDAERQAYQNANLDLSRRQLDFETSPDAVFDQRVSPLLKSGALGDISPDEVGPLFGLDPSSRAVRLAKIMQGEHLAGVAEGDAERSSAATLINRALADNERSRVNTAVLKAQMEVPSTKPGWFGRVKQRSPDEVSTDRAYAAMDYLGNEDTDAGGDPNFYQPPTRIAPALTRDNRSQIISSLFKNQDILAGLNIPDEGEITPRLRIGPFGTTPTAAPVLNPASVLAEARAAIARGKDPEIIRQRLLKMGITPDF